MFGGKNRYVINGKEFAEIKSKTAFFQLKINEDEEKGKKLIL
jgi:hypothetical protein